jgi:hypothetical protein
LAKPASCWIAIGAADAEADQAGDAQYGSDYDPHLHSPSDFFCCSNAKNQRELRSQQSARPSSNSWLLRRVSHHGDHDSEELKRGLARLLVKPR